MNLDKRDVRSIMAIFNDMPFEPEIPDNKSIASFDPDWEPTRERNWMGKLKPVNPETTAKAKYMWKKLQVACRQPGLLAELEIERDANLDRNFGLRSTKLFVESDEENEIDESKKVETLNDISKKKQLPWYLLSDES